VKLVQPVIQVILALQVIWALLDLEQKGLLALLALLLEEVEKLVPPVIRV
jgi:hypothetical protein